MAKSKFDSARGARRWPVSDHFDGKRFFNPTVPDGYAPTYRSIFKMLRTRRSRWPRSVENRSVPRLDAVLKPDDIAVTFVNHATFIIQLDNLVILTDPVWSERVSVVSWAGPRRARQPGVAFDALPKIDLVLLSHNHYDHCDLPTLRRLSKAFSPATVIAAGDAPLAAQAGFTDIRELDWWEETSFGPLKITFTPTQHSSARGLFDRQRSLWGAYMIESRGRLIYFGGDTGYSTHFADIRSRLGSPDVALLGIGAYEPRWFMTPIHMNPEEAVCAHRDLGAKHSIGMHFGTFQLTPEPIDQPVADLKVARARAGIQEMEFVTLDEGETRIYQVEARSRA